MANLKNIVFLCLIWSLSVQTRDGPWPDPTQEYFWSAVKKRGQPAFNPGTFWPDIMRFCFDPKGKNWKFGILRGNIPNPNPRWLNNVNKKKLSRPGLLIFYLNPSLVQTLAISNPCGCQKNGKNDLHHQHKQLKCDKIYLNNLYEKNYKWLSCTR